MKKFRSISLIETLISLAIVGISVVALLPVMTLKKDANDMTKGNAYWEIKSNNAAPVDPANNPISAISPVNGYSVALGTSDLPENGRFLLDNRGFNNIASLFVDKYLFFNGQLASQEDGNSIFLRSGSSDDTALQINGGEAAADTSYPRSLYVGSNITVIENNENKNNSFVITNGTATFDNITRTGVAIMHGGKSFLLADNTNKLVALGIGAGNRLTDSNNGSIVIANDFSTSPKTNISGKYLAIGNLKNETYDNTSNISTAGKYVIHKNLEGANNFIINAPISVNGNIKANAYIVPSDKNLKDILGKYTKGLDEILKIKPVIFTYKNDENNTEHVGVIAQDLQKIFPESVFKGGDGYLSVNTDATFYATLNSVKTLNEKNSVLEANNKNLEDKVKELRQIRDNLRANKGGKNE